ncbi:MAG: zinc-ribbon domain-containing protein [Clostridiales bacterium]|nr:zinc-ribbon domain-containing protein [Clostridiales bacterium]
MKCPRCGYENVEGALFCAKCAARLDGEAGYSEPAAPAPNIVAGPKWARPDFSADSVSENDVPEDFVSEYSPAEFKPNRERVRAAEEAAERARLAAADAEERRRIESELEADRRAAEENGTDFGFFDRRPARNEEERDPFEERRRVEFRAEPEEPDNGFDDDTDDDFEDELDARPVRRQEKKGLAPFFGGLFKHKEKPRTAPAYDEDDDYSDDDDDYEPKKYRKKSSGSFFSNKNTMNIAIRIAALVAVLAVLALIIFGIASLAKSCSNKNNSPTGTNKAPIIEQNPEDASSYFVTIYAKEGKVLIYETSDGTRKEVTVPSSGFVKFKVPVSSLMPNEPVDGTTYAAKPKVYIKNDDGTETLIDGIEPIMLQIPAINVRFDNADTIVSEDGSVEISGHVDLIATEIKINGEAVEVAQDGSFSHTVKYEDTGDYVIEAEGRLAGHQVYRHSFNVTVMQAKPSVSLIELPWQYGDNTYSQRVKNAVDTIEVRGRVPAGSTVNASCPGSTNATITTPVVNADGTFTFSVQMAVAGDYKLLITCTTSDGRYSEREMHVQRAPEYMPYKNGALQMNYASFAYSTSQAYKISGTVTEIIQDGDFILAKLTTADGKELIIEYHNHYGTAGTITVGKTYNNIYGRSLGLNDDGIPQIYVWFVDD